MERIANNDGLGVHVLLIGIERYADESLPSLASSARSVGLLAEWWSEKYFNPAAPLSSLEVLSSDLDSPSGGATSFASIAQTIRNWSKRASAHPDNIAVFYFAGHGYETSSGLCLMASDLSLRPRSPEPPDQAFLVAPLIDALKSGPVRQLWMFDASRVPGGPTAEAVQPRPVLHAELTFPGQLRRLILYGAQRGGHAYAGADEASDLALAFLDTVTTSARPLDTAILATGIAERVRKMRPEPGGAGVEIQLTAPFELLAAPVGHATPPGESPAAPADALPPAPAHKSRQEPAVAAPDRERPESPAEPQAPVPPQVQEPAPPPAPQAPHSPRSPRPDLEFLDDDAEIEVDSLGRGALAVVVARRLHAIWRKSNPAAAPSAIEDRAAFVMHIDAPWGGGKTTFANFIARALNPYGYGTRPARFLRERYGETAGLGAVFVADPPTAEANGAGTASEAHAASGVPGDHRRPWIVIEYNAWRMEHTSPPWWTFYQVIRKGSFGAIRREGSAPADIARPTPPDAQYLRNHWSWITLWARELGWRLWTPKLIVPLAGFLVSAMVFVILWQLGLVGSYGAAGKEATGFNEGAWPSRIVAGLGALTVIGGAISLIMESLAPGVDPLAERLGLGRSDPLERFRTHFHKTMCRLERPVLVVIDDLDRCKPAVIVDLVRGIQTILRSPRVVFLVLGDRNWLECAFEAVHTDMAKVVGGVEQSVGARFVEKAIQLSFLLPGLDQARQSAFVAGLLRDGADAQPAPSSASVTDLRAAARVAARELPSAAFDAGELRASVLLTEQGREFISQMETELQQAGTQAGTTVQPTEAEAEARRQAAQIVNEEIAIQAAVAPSVEAETAKRLEPLAPWLPGNPRQIKRILNGIALYHAAGLQHPSFSIARRWFQLALWVVLMTEWPATWRVLCACPELGDILCDPAPLEALAKADPMILPGSPAATEREVQRILNSAELMALIAGKNGRAGDRLDTEAVRDLLTLTPPNAKLPRLTESEASKEAPSGAKAKKA